LTKAEQAMKAAVLPETPARIGQSVHVLFEEQATLAPNRDALRFEGGRLSYGDLNQRANHLARTLRQLGVRPDQGVGVLIERSPEMIIGLLAILKAGGAYVPLDPAWPERRLDFVLEDSAVEIVLTQPSLRDRFSGAPAEIVCLEAADSARDDSNPNNLVHSGNLAYICYTSGSTGAPKGVLIEHRGVVRLVKDANYLSLGPKDVTLQIAPLAFDASAFEIWGALLNGGCCALYPPALPSISGLGRRIRRLEVTSIFLIPPLFHAAVDENLSVLAPTRYLFVGGDVVSPEHVRQALRGLPGTRITLCYGPTENSCITTTFAATAENMEGRTTAPLGQAISNTQVYVLDENLQPVPPGDTGELCAGGQGVARGYWKRDQLTAEKFLPDPFYAGGRLFRTGDRVRLMPDGNLEFLGRLDQQVKIRGYRIELLEIEAVLRQHPQVREAAVLADEERPGQKTLTAYVLPNSDSTPTSAELRSFLAQSLPEWMWPAKWILMESLPFNASGKIDRLALSGVGDALRWRPFSA
jgi:amino acid adenylation domain-containing protein